MPSLYPHVAAHFALLEQISQTKDPNIKKALCLQDIALVPEFCKEWIMDVDQRAEHSMMMDRLIGETHPLEYYKKKMAHMYTLPRYPSFKTLAIIYEREGDYESAINICKDAIAAGFEDDGTKGGMIARLQKLIEKAEA